MCGWRRAEVAVHLHKVVENKVKFMDRKEVSKAEQGIDCGCCTCAKKL